MSPATPQPKLPTSNIDSEPALKATSEHWFEYPVRAQPHHTDYAGIVWHGTYLAWLEEARVEYLRSIGVNFADLVALGCDLPVVEMSIRYRLPIRLGMEAVVKARMNQLEGVRMNWDYEIKSPQGDELYVTAKVTLVGIDRDKGKIMRQLPPAVKNLLQPLIPNP